MKIKAIDGLPVEDAKRPILLKITKGDCKKADRKEPSTCAVAQAFYRQTNAQEVRIHLARAYVKTTPDKWVRYIVEKAMRLELVVFDRGGTFAPGEYRLSAPQPSKRIGARPAKPGPKLKRGTPRRPPHVLVDVRHGPA
jgi:hypothetical protein